jgi:hypothetical protein
MTEEANSAEKFYKILEGNADAQPAIERVVTSMQRELLIFDSSPQNLHARGFGNTDRIDYLRKVLLANQTHNIRIALHTTQGIEGEVPRLISLMNQLSSQIMIHRTLGDAADARDVLVIADQSHFWRKPRLEHSRSIVTLNSQTDTRPFVDRFEEIWAQSEPAVSIRALGL